MLYINIALIVHSHTSHEYTHNNFAANFVANKIIVAGNICGPVIFQAGNENFQATHKKFSHSIYPNLSLSPSFVPALNPLSRIFLTPLARAFPPLSSSCPPHRTTAHSRHLAAHPSPFHTGTAQICSRRRLHASPPPSSLTNSSRWRSITAAPAFIEPPGPPQFASSLLSPQF